MNLIDAIKLYCHVMQQEGGGLRGRDAARDALLHRGVQQDVCTIIAEAISNEGIITSGNGATYALTQIGTM